MQWILVGEVMILGEVAVGIHYVRRTRRELQELFELVRGAHVIPRDSMARRCLAARGHLDQAWAELHNPRGVEVFTETMAAVGYLVDAMQDLVGKGD